MTKLINKSITSYSVSESRASDRISLDVNAKTSRLADGTTT